MDVHVPRTVVMVVAMTMVVVAMIVVGVVVVRSGHRMAPVTGAVPDAPGPAGTGPAPLRFTT